MFFPHRKQRKFNLKSCSSLTSRQIGVLGEEIAQDYLKRKGYCILDTNYYPIFALGSKNQKGEIDIIAKKKGIIHFIEVKTLRTKYDEKIFSAMSPEEKVGFRKQQKIIKIAEIYILDKKLSLDIQMQIDIIAIKIRRHSSEIKIQHFENI